MSGVPSDMAGHPMRSPENDALFGMGRSLHGSHTAEFSSPAMKPHLAINVLKRGFEESTDLWARVEGAMEWDMRSPEHIELEELDGMLDDF